MNAPRTVRARGGTGTSIAPRSSAGATRAPDQSPYAPHAAITAADPMPHAQSGAPASSARAAEIAHATSSRTISAAGTQRAQDEKTPSDELRGATLIGIASNRSAPFHFGRKRQPAPCRSSQRLAA